MSMDIVIGQSRRSTITEYPSLFALPHSPRFTKNIKVQNVLRFSINSRQSVFNTVYSVRCLSCLRVKGSFQEAALIIFPSTPIKNTEDGMKRWLRRAKKRRSIGCPLDLFVLSGLPKIEKWKLIDSKTGQVRSNYKFVQGWMNSIRAIMLLWRNLKAKELKFLSLRNLNQDPLENLFGQIRQHGICNTNPTCYQFVAALKTVVINNFGAPISRGNNCEEDYCKSLGDFSTFLQNYSLAENAEGSAKDNDINSDIDLDKESNFDDYNQATAYVAGYILKKINVPECNKMTKSPD
ncbi:hypothetical protein NQ317_005394 [Molorchus minor]|uniref:Transposable element P transposase-like RNase H C-terminal domain-containing protein n=1 Tax=Molorchus minor TaxID=1323400 RepID=A0ABQ9IS18_9CUCU|nr:hypothetical protein NQ317_005394 [Molorchus minor]